MNLFSKIFKVLACTATAVAGFTASTASADFTTIPGADGIDYKFWTPDVLCIVDPETDQGNLIYSVFTEGGKVPLVTVALDCPALGAGEAEAMIQASRAAATWSVIGDLGANNPDFEPAAFVEKAVASYPSVTEQDANTKPLVELVETYGGAFNYASDARSSQQVRVLDRGPDGFVVELSASIFLGTVAAKFTLVTAAPDRGALGAPIALIGETLVETFDAYDSQVTEKAGSN